MDKINLSDYIKEYISNISNKDEVKISDILRIVSKVLNKDINYIHLEDIYVSQNEKVLLKNNLDKYYINKIPLQYILGYQFFYNEEYLVDENVLIPRSDSEILVEKAVYYSLKENIQNMLDMCCGSGCLGISILNNSDIKKCTFVDISKKALDVTNKNIIHNKVSKNVLTINSDLFKNINDKFDLIVSNPPYIKTKEIEKLSDYVKNEPILALDGGTDGLDIYRRIIAECTNYLNDNGYLILEIGYDELEDIKELIKLNKDLEFVESDKDLGNNDRVVICRFHQK